jgi:hypothetical protein
MLDRLRMTPVLRGARGQAPADLDALSAVIARFSRLAADLPALAEIEVNPLRVRADGLTAVDARGTLQEA